MSLLDALLDALRAEQHDSYRRAGAFVLTNGRPWAWSGLPGDRDWNTSPCNWRSPGVCWSNAAHIARDDSGLTYVEGFAVVESDVHWPKVAGHAWCVDTSGRVIDTTWGEERWPGDRAYFGVPFKRSFVVRTLLRRVSTGSIFDLCLDDPERLKAAIETSQAAS